jgi:hypothetical protein
MTMKLAKTFANLFAVMAVALCLGPGVRAQADPAAPVTDSKPAHKPAHKAKSKAKAAASTAVPAAQPEAAGDAAATGGEAKVERVANQRDPFVPLVNTKKDQDFGHLPPGKAGLVISTVRIDGTVRSPGGMIAVVTNPEQRVYFIREGDRLYDGSVEKIGLDGVTFRESSKDAFGKPVERSVTKRIYPSAGEQQ